MTSESESNEKGASRGTSLTPLPFPCTEECVLVRWRVKAGAYLRPNQVVAECRRKSGGAAPVIRVRAPIPGCVAELMLTEGDSLAPGQVMLEIEQCTHPTVMKDMCAECGTDLRSDDKSQTNVASVAMVHSVPELKVSEELALELGKKDSERLLKDRKLVLLVDLDQTLIHTTNDIVPSNLKDVHHFQLRSWGPGAGGRWYHTRLRPGTLKFLKAISAVYELHICTFGARAYAHKVAELLDPHGELFSHRILSRDECFDIHTKTPNLRALFPCGDNLVCIIDDREDVWNRALNLIQVKPYHFFEHTGDINAPPGLGKTERDIEGQGFQAEDAQLKKENSENEVKSDTGSKELPVLDSCETDTVPDSTQIKTNTETDLAAENTQKSISTENLENSNNEKTDTINNDEIKTVSEIKNNETSDNNHENAIVKDIEKIVTQVQENFINADSTANKKSEPDSSEDAIKNDSEKVNNSENNSTNTPNVENQNIHVRWKLTSDGLIDVEDGDDYLLYLEEILQRIHAKFYEMYDGMEAGTVPDLKSVIPEVKARVLAGTSLVFSGLVPTHQKLEHSRAYMVAQSLGAEVTQDFTDRTTHLVAVRPGTAKVHACRRAPTGIGKPTPHIVTPAWLWCCAERWQHVEERLFPLRGGANKYPRRPPPHCGSPPRIPHQPTAARRRTPSGRFMDTINPLLSFSSDDIADMDKEVEDIINESDESESEDNVNSKTENSGEQRLTDNVFDDDLENHLKYGSENATSGSESIESISDEERSLNWQSSKSRKRKRRNSLSEYNSDLVSHSKIPKDNLSSIKNIDIDTCESSTNDEFSSERFRRGGNLPSDGPDQNDSDTIGSNDPSDDMDDGEWNMMGAALEREFLGLDK